MKLLLDTHAWIWSQVAPQKLGKRALKAIQHPDAQIWLSSISVWETLLLIEHGRLKVKGQPQAWVQKALHQTGAQEAPVTHEIAVLSRQVQLPHEDPADRFLVATALHLGLRLVTADNRILASKPCELLVID